jgi:hypothetical protein
VSESWLDEVVFDSEGLIPAIAQEVGTGRLLMTAWMNREALTRIGGEDVAAVAAQVDGRLVACYLFRGDLPKVGRRRRVVSLATGPWVRTLNPCH